jgi:hypothetical protein
VAPDPEESTNLKRRDEIPIRFSGDHANLLRPWWSISLKELEELLYKIYEQLDYLDNFKTMIATVEESSCLLFTAKTCSGS